MNYKDALKNKKDNDLILRNDKYYGKRDFHLKSINSTI
jgi:hypothetical protein